MICQILSGIHEMTWQGKSASDSGDLCYSLQAIATLRDVNATMSADTAQRDIEHRLISDEG